VNGDAQAKEVMTGWAERLVKRLDEAARTRRAPIGRPANPRRAPEAI